MLQIYSKKICVNSVKLKKKVMMINSQDFHKTSFLLVCYIISHNRLHRYLSKNPSHIYYYYFICAVFTCQIENNTMIKEACSFVSLVIFS